MSDLETWNDAENICERISKYHGGHLATVSTLELNSAISNYIVSLNPENVTTEIWIGLKNIDFEKGSTLVYTTIFSLFVHVIIDKKNQEYKTHIFTRVYRWSSGSIMEPINEYQWSIF